MSPITVVSISIGPVQEFIAAARRTRDFAFGSFLLAQLARTATKIIQPHAKPIVFPAAPEADAANKILYIHDSSIAVPVLMEEVDRALRALVETEIRRIVADKRLPEESILRAVAQARDVVEFYWASATHDTYPEAYRDAEAGLAARKSFRDFAVFPMGTRLPKSSITGTYESIIPEELYSPSGARRLYNDFRARSAERLSGIDVLKRIGNLDFREQFPSTAEMAARSALIRSGMYDVQTRTLAEGFDQAWQAMDAHLGWIEATHQNQNDARYAADNAGRSYAQSTFRECLFVERIDDVVVQTHDQQLVVETHKAFVAEVNRVTGTKLRLDKPYYAVLQADGDRMGDMIQRCLRTADPLRAHVDFSTALSGFSSSVRDIVARHAGETVYAGGDDVLALLPLQTAVACAEALQEAFRIQISEFAQAHGLVLEPTLSAGVVIVHHMDPMSDVLDIVRATEKVAKRKRGSLALAVSKRSGGVVTVTGRWDEGFVSRLSTLINLFQAKKLPHGYAYELRNLIARISDGHTDDVDTATIIALESGRILKRKKLASGEDAPIELLTTLLQSIPATDSGARMSEWVNELIIAREIAS